MPKTAAHRGIRAAGAIVRIATVGIVALASAPGAAAAPAGVDPYLWLEEIEGERALDWVRARNERTLTKLEADPRFEPFLAAGEAVLNATDRIPYGTYRDGYIDNFWQDAEHVRGVWRRTTLESYRTDAPEWTTLLDVDALAEADGENWVFKGVSVLAPEYDRALVTLSRGGKDAAVVREYDLASRSFVEGGFEIPEAKADVAWLSRDELLIGTDWGEGSLTESGYPRFVKRWRRGTPLESAVTVFEAEATDVGAWPWVDRRPEGTTAGVVRSPTTFTNEPWILTAAGALKRLPVPDSAELTGTFAGQVLVRLREEWTPPGAAGASLPAGALVSFPLARFLETGELPPVETVFAPDDRTTIDSVRDSKSVLWIALLRNVQAALLRFEYDPEEGWRSEEISLPGPGTVRIAGAGAFHDVAFLSYADYLTPSRLLETAADRDDATLLKSMPARFDASGAVVEQFEVERPDGERVPYSLVRPRDLPMDGSTPTILYGYGGFEISQSPSYRWQFGKLWLERGGAFAFANIRGGGEFGPRWHRAALKEKRQVSHDDFHAIAEDLVKRKITSPEGLGIMGGSQGGLLVGVALTQRPELYGAVVCQVPLLDMLRYHHLLAGASWMGEYGDPDDPAMREVIAAYSPYHNVREGVEYPPTIFLTSTKDDRVHPGHARKMAARLAKVGAPVEYYENIEGGHAAGSNRNQRAYRIALEFVFLSRQLGLE